MPGEAAAFSCVTERVSPFAFGLGLGEGRDLAENAVTSGCSVAERARENELEHMECRESAVSQTRPEDAVRVLLGCYAGGVAFSLLYPS